MIEAGTAVKVTKGSHRKKRGTVIKKRPVNGHQRGKTPIVVGCRNDVIWVRPEWLEVDDLYAREDFSQSDLNESNYMGNEREIQCNQLQQSDSLKESEDSAEQQSLQEDLNGDNQSKSMTMPSPYCDRTSTTISFTEISATTFLAKPTSIQSDSPAPGLAMQESVQDLTTQNQPSGLKPSDVSVSADLHLFWWSNLKGLSTEDFEQSLADSEWQDILGIIRSFCKARKSALANTAPDYLSSPTLTASSGVASRPAGATKCERWLKDKGIIPHDQVLSTAGMALLSDFPPNWTDCLLELSPSKNDTDSEADISTDEQSSPLKQLSHLKESNTSIHSPGIQWIDPKLVQLKSGTQPRDCDETFAGEAGKIQQYAEDMRSGLWNFVKKPLPIAFVDSEGKIHASDCHHRVSAAIAADIEKIQIDLRAGELLDAKLFAVTANTDHGLPLRPKDQRKRIEMCLDLLENIDDARSRSLLEGIPNLGTIQKTNSLKGHWTARTIAKYLKLNESGYRTVQTIMLERRRIKAYDFNPGDFTRVMGGDFDWEGKIHSFDRRKGVFVIPLPWSLGNDGRILPSQWIEPWDLSKLNPDEMKKIAVALHRNNQREKPVFASTTSESYEAREKLGLPIELPDIKSNEGDPDSLIHSFGCTSPTAESLFPVIEQLSRPELIKLWEALDSKIKAFSVLHKVEEMEVRDCA